MSVCIYVAQPQSNKKHKFCFEEVSHSFKYLIMSVINMYKTFRELEQNIMGLGQSKIYKN